MTRDGLLLALTPAAAAATVALGLRVGAPGDVRAAVVYGAPAPIAGGTLAWPVVVLREAAGAREPVPGLTLDVDAYAGARAAHWRGATNDDGVAECLLPLGDPPALAPRLRVRAGAAILAEGVAARGPAGGPPPRASPWLPFARREGPIELDAALLGERAAPGSPADVWVRAVDRATRLPVEGAAIEMDGDASLAPSVSRATTDARGWAELTAAPVGLALTITLRARGRDGASGEWIGGAPMSPGAARVDTRLRWAPGDEPEIDLVEPMEWRSAYVEVDDARGRAWAATVPAGVARSDGTSAAGVRAPRLPPGLYWAVVSATPFGEVEGASRTSWRPFFVAAGDGEALAMGGDPGACAAPRDPRDVRRALATCLALSPWAPPPRWAALDGLRGERARDDAARARGLRVALTGLLIAALLEASLLLRAAARARARLLAGTGGDAAARAIAPARRWGVAVSVLVGLLGFALLAAFLIRVG